MWWGYVILLTVIVCSISGVYFWCHKVGYDCPLVRNNQEMIESVLMSEIELVAPVQHLIEGLAPRSL